MTVQHGDSDDDDDGTVQRGNSDDNDNDGCSAAIAATTTKQAEPWDTLVAKLGLSQADILSLNSGISCDGPIPAGKVLCIQQPKQESLLAQTPAPACKTQAAATDTTCDALATKFGLTPQKFAEYNDNVNSDCTNLVPGQAYCVALD
ncbi:hypothetical protein EDB84DRAFT_1581060 [Lactarius hengduanensis]|nr:hypothetical protein EDB84DRAFT_1581060 [Lactarius hengduanensis]